MNINELSQVLSMKNTFFKWMLFLGNLHILVNRKDNIDILL